MRFMGLLKSTPETENGSPNDPELFAKMGALIQEITEAGVMLDTQGLQPSSQGKRVSLHDGKVTVTDGPFTESKELVASYAIYQVPTIEDAVYWTRRFLEVLGEGECEIRPIYESGDFSPDVFPPDEAAKEAALREVMKENARHQL